MALTIAGSDSGGGAGIEADLKTFTVLGCFGTVALTAVTAQNTRGVQAAAMLSPDLVVQQIDSVADDIRPAAAKTGMLGAAPVVEAVAAAIERHGLSPLVVDPVMIAKSGDSLIAEDAVEAIARRLLPLAAVVTPNRHEAARLAGFPVETLDDARRAAETICHRFGASACAVTGLRHEEGERVFAVDVVYPTPDTGGRGPRIMLPWQGEGQKNSHGSGCTFSAALTAFLARGLDAMDALEEAIRFIDRALHSPVRYGGGVSPVDHLAGMEVRPLP